MYVSDYVFVVDIKMQGRNNKAKGNRVFILKHYLEAETCNDTWALGKKKQGTGTKNAPISIFRFGSSSWKQT